MTWFGQGVFALPCGSSGGAESYGVTLEDNNSTDLPTFEPIGNLSLSVPVAQAREATITVTGSVSTAVGGEVAEFAIYVDDVAMDDVVAATSATDNGPVAVAVTAHIALAAGSHTIEARWRAVSGMVTAFTGHLHLEVIVAQAVP